MGCRYRPYNELSIKGKIIRRCMCMFIAVLILLFGFLCITAVIMLAIYNENYTPEYVYITNNTIINGDSVLNISLPENKDISYISIVSNSFFVATFGSYQSNKSIYSPEYPNTDGNYTYISDEYYYLPNGDIDLYFKIHTICSNMNFVNYNITLQNTVPGGYKGPVIYLLFGMFSLSIGLSIIIFNIKVLVKHIKLKRNNIIELHEQKTNEQP